jgi:transcription elongation factor GreA
MMITKRIAADIGGESTLDDPMPQTHHLSRGAFERLTAELEELTTRGRVDIARKIEAARELGDLSENGDYHAAKEEQGKMEARIRHISAMLDNAEIVDATGADSVTPGSVVTIRYDGDDDVETYLIGSIEERHGDLEVISPGSPLGEALIGAKVGDSVTYTTPTGAVITVEVADIET